MSSSSTTTTADAVAHEAAAAALRTCAPAIGELGRALADLRACLPEELRTDAERVFMNAFGNAVWAEGRGDSG